MSFGRTSHCSETDLNALLDAQLAIDAKQRTDAHISACGPCREKLNHLSAVRSSLRSLPRAAAPRSFRLREAQVGRAPQRRQPLLLRAMPALSGLSAVSLVVFLVLLAVEGGAPGSLGSSSSKSASSANVNHPASLDSGVPIASPTPLQSGAVADSAAPSTQRASGAAADSAAPSTNGTTANAPETKSLARSSAGQATPSTGGLAAPARAGASGNNLGMHIAEAVAAALALASGGLAFAAWCRSS